MSNPQVGIDIVANDKSAKGIGAAEKRLGQLGGRATKIGGEIEKVGSRGIMSLGRTIVEVDEAASKAFGVSSPIGGFVKRVGAFRVAGSALSSSLGRTATGMAKVEAAGASVSSALNSTAEAAAAMELGMGEAAAASAGLVLAMGPVAAVGAAAVVTLGAAAAAGYKFSSAWAGSTAQMGRFADSIGVSTKNLQELQGAAARYGIAKDAAAGGIASFAQITHDARYGRNNDALALMHRLGVGFRNRADGTLDYDAMLGDTADALKRQRDPQTALMVANRLGVAGLLPMLRQGGANLRSEKASFARDGFVASGEDVANATAFTRNATILGQMATGMKEHAQAWTAGKYAPQLGRGVELARGTGIGGAAGASAIGASAWTIANAALGEAFGSAAAAAVPPARMMREAGDKQLRAATMLGTMVAGPGAHAAFFAGGGGPRNALEMAAMIEHLGERSKQWQTSPKGAAGVMQLMPGTAEAVARRNGIGWDPHRFRTDEAYNRHLGELEVGRLWTKFNGDPALIAAAYNAGDGVLSPGGYRDNKTHKHQESWLKRYGDPRAGQVSDAEFAKHIPFDETRAYVQRVLAGEVRFEHVHKIEGLPRGAKATSQTRGSPRISRSMSWDD